MVMVEAKGGRSLEDLAGNIRYFILLFGGKRYPLDFNLIFGGKRYIGVKAL